MGADRALINSEGHTAYAARVSGDRIYDANRDVLGYWSNPNREKADQKLRDSGFAGFSVTAGDGRKVVKLWEPVNVENVGPAKGAAKAQFRPDGVIRRFEEDAPQFRPDGNPETQEVAKKYFRAAFAKDYDPSVEYLPLPEHQLMRVADAKHDPEAPEVRRSYAALIEETKRQYQAIEAAGFRVEPWAEKGEPYASSAEMMKDVAENKHLWFLPTNAAFGSGDSIAHPMLAPAGVKIGDRELLANDLFRAVHDFFGHTQQGFQFGPRGEFNAWKSHAKMFSAGAQGALAAETLAQNAWVNFGPHLRDAAGKIAPKGEPGHVPPQDRPFAEQKAFVAPRELWSQLRPDGETPGQKLEARLKEKGYRFTSKFDGYAGTLQAVAGRTMAGELSYFIDRHNFAEINGIFVEPSHRKQGIAEALYRRLGRELQAKGVEDVGGRIAAQVTFDLRQKVFGKAENVSDIFQDIDPAAARAQLSPLMSDPMKTDFWVRNKVDSEAQFRPDGSELPAPDGSDTPGDHAGDTTATRIRIHDFYAGFVHPHVGREAAHPAAGRPELHVRGATVDATELVGDGRGYNGFFSAVTAGTAGRQGKGRPYSPVLKLPKAVENFRAERERFRGNFDNHIATSIPGFEEVQSIVGAAIVGTFGEGARMLDIGASEGALAKAVTIRSGGKISTVALDPNPAMARHFAGSPVDGSTYRREAFGSAKEAGSLAWEEPDGTRIHYFDPQGTQFDVVHEAMVFQFISNARNAQISRVKELLKPGGVGVFEEKVGNRRDVWDANEKQKDDYKGLYYTEAEMATKRREVLEKGGHAVEGMDATLVAAWELEEALAKNFSSVVQFWDSGNFKGYVAGDSPATVAKFVENLAATHSGFSTTDTPRVVAGLPGGGRGENAGGGK